MERPLRNMKTFEELSSKVFTQLVKKFEALKVGVDD